MINWPDKGQNYQAELQSDNILTDNQSDLS